MAKKLSKEQWEQRIRDAGSGRYEFIRWTVDGEVGALKRCVVRCVKDGYEWSATVDKLVNGGRGCQKCAGNGRLTSEERIKQINSLQNIEFISWDGEYKNQKSKANVKCKVDGLIWSSTVNNLVNCGQGCPQCAGNRLWTAKERIEQINKLENINFISWVDGYKGSSSKANVRCKVDGFEWSASVNSLVNQGFGCPSCAKGGYDPSETGTLYALRSECGQYIKVGISNDLKRRHKRLEKRTPFKFNLVEQISGDGAKIAELEKHFHLKYERAGFTGFDGCTEWLICTQELLQELRNLGDKQ